MEENQTNMNEVEKLFAAGSHLGHKKNRLHPKARKYVYRIVNGVAVIDLTKTATQLIEARKFLSTAAKEGKRLLVVGTKRVSSQHIQDICKAQGISYITTKWMPGLLTNFETISKNVKKMNDLEAQKNDGTWEQYVKHERTKLGKELNRLKRLYSGISDMKKRPDVLFIVDIKREKNALKEAKQNNIPVVAITDTNTNPDTVEFPVVANDDSPTSSQYVISTILESYNSGEQAVEKPKKSEKETVAKAKTEKKNEPTEEKIEEKGEKKPKKVKRVAKKE